jgi:hypothetical protein
MRGGGEGGRFQSLPSFLLPPLRAFRPPYVQEGGILLACFPIEKQIGPPLPSTILGTNPRGPVGGVDPINLPNLGGGLDAPTHYIPRTMGRALYDSGGGRKPPPLRRCTA